MNAHSIRHAWFPPTVPKRKHDKEYENESGWPSSYNLVSEPSEPRPTKRLRHLEGGLAKLNLRAKNPGNAEFSVESTPTPVYQTQDTPLGGEVAPSIYEYTLPHTATATSAASLPLQGEVSEANTSDEDWGMKDDTEERRMNGARMGNGTFVPGEEGMPGYTVYEPESGPEKRKREIGDDEHGLEKRGKMTWYEPEKDRIVILDLDSSEDESVTHSPRRTRSASSPSSPSQGSPTRSRSKTGTRPTESEFSINPLLLSCISSGAGVLTIPREDNPATAIVLYKPPPWAAGVTQAEPEVGDIEDVSVGSGCASMDDTPLIQNDEDAMDIDSSRARKGLHYSSRALEGNHGAPLSQVSLSNRTL